MSAESKRPGTEAPNGLEDATSAPPRLLDDPAVGSSVREDLRRAAAAVPLYDVGAGMLALQAAIAASGAASTAAGAASGAASSGTVSTTAVTAGASKGAAGAAISATVKTSLAVKLAVSGGVVIAAVAATLALQSPTRAPAEVGPRAALQGKHAAAAEKDGASGSREHVAQPGTGPQLEPQAFAPHAEPAALPIHAHDAQPAASREALGRAHATRVPPDGAAREVAQLARIKALLSREPHQALALAEAGHREFRGGYLHHEREALAIVALEALGRTSRARARAQIFLGRYPHGPMSERVRELFGKGEP